MHPEESLSPPGRVVIAIYTIVIFLLCASVKEIGLEQHRPFLKSGYVLIIIGCFLAAARHLVSGRIFFLNKLILMSLAILVIMSTQAIFDPLALKQFVMMLAMMVGLPFAASAVKNRYPLYRCDCIAKTILAAALLFTVTAVIMSTGSPISLLGYTFESKFVFSQRWHGLAGEPTHFGAFVALALLSFIYLRTRKLLNPGLKSNLILIVLLTALVFSGSRNSILSLMVACAITYASYYHKMFRYFLMAVTLLLPVSLFAISYMDNITEILASSFRIGVSASEETRMERLMVTFSYIMNQDNFNFLFGNGFKFDRIQVINSMSGYIAILINHGLIFLVVYLSAIYYLYRHIRSCHKVSKALMDYLTSLLIFFLVFNTFLDVSFIHVFQIAGMIIPLIIFVLSGTTRSPYFAAQTKYCTQ